MKHHGCGVDGRLHRIGVVRQGRECEVGEGGGGGVASQGGHEGGDQQGARHWLCSACASGALLGTGRGGRGGGCGRNGCGVVWWGGFSGSKAAGAAEDDIRRQASQPAPAWPTHQQRRIDSAGLLGRLYTGEKTRFDEVQGWQELACGREQRLRHTHAWAGCRDSCRMRCAPSPPPPHPPTPPPRGVAASVQATELALTLEIVYMHCNASN